MNLFFLRLIIYHIIGDFYLQSNKLAYLKVNNYKNNGENKKQTYNCKYLVIHVLLYLIPFILLFAFVNWDIALLLIGMNGITHFIIDYFTGYLKRKDKNNFLILLLDQFLHILILYITFYAFKNDFTYRVDYYFNDITIKIIFSALFLILPSAIIVDKLFVSIDFNKIILNSNDTNKEDNQTIDNEEANEIIEKEEIVKTKRFDTGFVIGIVERLIMFILLCYQAFTSLVLIVTIKTWARSNDLKDNDFRNKYLVGTLMSFLLSLITYFLFQL